MSLHLCLYLCQQLLQFVHVRLGSRPTDAKSFMFIWFGNLPNDQRIQILVMP